MQWSQTDKQYMLKALELANHAKQNDEVPVGAVLVHQNDIIGAAGNAPIHQKDTTAHAEILAIRQGCLHLNNYRLPESTLYLTLEPCAMCAGAIVHARIQRVVIATKEPRAGAAGSIMDILQNPKLNHCCDVEFGLYQEQSAQLLRAFFKKKRNKK